MSQPPINIVAAEPVGDYRLRLTFDDGMEQTVDFKPFLTRTCHPDIQILLSRSSAMKRWIEGLSRLEDAESDMNEFAHHGADDDSLRKF
jgi:DUF971 family protein